MAIKALFVDYYPKALLNELAKRGYKTSTFWTPDSGSMLSRSSLTKFDVVYFAKFNPPLWNDLSLLFNKSKTPILYAYHAPLVIFYPYRPKNHLWNLISLSKAVYMKASNSFNAIHSLNFADHVVASRMGLNSYFRPLGIETDTFKPQPKNEDFTVLFASARFQKGTDMLTKIIPRVLKKAPKVKFALVGRGLLERYYSALKEAFPKNVDVYGFMPSEEYVTFFSGCHVFLFPSRYESFGVAPLEALSCGMPVVCFKISGIPEDTVLHNKVGAVLPPFDIDGIVNAVTQYYYMWKDNNAAFDALSQKCRNVALKYDWHIIAQDFDFMLNAVLTNSR